MKVEASKQYLLLCDFCSFLGSQKSTSSICCGYRGKGEHKLEMTAPGLLHTILCDFTGVDSEVEVSPIRHFTQKVTGF